MKKLFGTLGLVLIVAMLFASCANGNKDEDDSKKASNSGSSSSSSSSSNSSASNSDLTINTDKIVLSDGTWNYDIAMPRGYVERGTFIVSDSTTKLTYTKIYEGTNAYVNEMSEDRFNARNSNPENNIKNDFNDSTSLNSEYITVSIKTNNDKTKYKSIFTDTTYGDTSVTTTLLEKVQ